MMVSFDFFNAPIDFEKNNINTVIIENKKQLVDVLTAFYNNNTEEHGIVFSESYVPIKFNSDIEFIPDLFSLRFSSSFIKKLYESLSIYANNEMQKEISDLNNQMLSFIEKLNQSFDFDLEYDFQLNIQGLLKGQNIQPLISKESLCECLLDYISMLQKYSPKKCYIIFNLHMLLDNDILTLFLKEIKAKSINLLLIEGKMEAHVNKLESKYILDDDLCEIIENCD